MSITEFAQAIDVARDSHTDSTVALEAVPRHNVGVESQPAAEAVGGSTENHRNLLQVLQADIVKMTKTYL